MMRARADATARGTADTWGDSWSGLLGRDEGAGDEVVGTGERLADKASGRVEGEVDVDALAGVGEQQRGGAIGIADAVGVGGKPGAVGLGGEECLAGDGDALRGAGAGGGVAGDPFVVDERGGVAQGGGEAAQGGGVGV